MPFEERIGQTNTLVEVLNSRILSSGGVASRLFFVSSGYENLASATVKGLMRFNRTPTAKFIRFTPDCFVVDKKYPDKVYLLDYKTTQTPIYSLSRIRSIGQKAGKPTLRWQDVGQMEADAYDSYSRIQGLGVRVVVLNYCAYHERLLLCEFIERICVLHRDVVTTDTPTGSRTPFVNFDCTSMRTFAQFLHDEHGLILTQPLYQSACEELSRKLPVEHHPSSPLHPNRRQQL